MKTFDEYEKEYEESIKKHGGLCPVDLSKFNDPYVNRMLEEQKKILNRICDAGQ